MKCAAALKATQKVAAASGGSRGAVREEAVCATGRGAWRVNWNMISVAPTKSQKSFLAYAKSEIEFFTLDKALQAQSRGGGSFRGCLCVRVCV